MRGIGCIVLLGLLSLLAACAQQTFDAGARAALAVVEDERSRIPAPPPPRCPQAHYRLPVVTQIQVPDTIVGGVLIPRHTSYVVLQPGAWQVVDAEALRQPGAPALPPGCQPPPGGR